MKTYFYYAFHTLINQIRKLCRTWVVLILIAAGIGGFGIGYGAGMFSDQTADKEPSVQETQAADEAFSSIEDTFKNTFSSPAQAAETIACVLTIGTLVYQTVRAEEDGARFFQPADSVLLFTSPMKPQRVLLFRLMMQVGLFLLAGIYAGFYMPGLIADTGIHPLVVILSACAWVLLTIYGRFLQTYWYLLIKQDHKWKKILNVSCYSLLVLLILYTGLSARLSGKAPFAALEDILSASWLRWVPVLGWLKGICGCAFSGNFVFSLVFLLLSIAGLIVLLKIMDSMKVDFYEEAAAAAEKTAEKLQAVKDNKNVSISTKKKDWSKVETDGLKGQGAQAFFWKTLYNRKRFAKYGFLTKTLVAYFLAAVLVSFGEVFVFDMHNILPVVLVLCVFAFFRSAGNPIIDDTKNHFFRMIPISEVEKLFWISLGGLVVCVLDSLPAFLVSALILQVNPFSALGGMVLVATMDTFASSVMMFLDNSLASLTLQIRQAVEILFIYFGLVPDIIIMAYFYMQDQILRGALLCGLINLAAGLFFQGLCAGTLSPYGGKPVVHEGDYQGDLKQTKKNISRIAWAVVVFNVIAQGLQTIAAAVLPEILNSQWLTFLMTDLSLYACALPLMYLLLKKVPKVKIPEKNLSLLDWAKAFAVCFFLMYTANIVSSLILSRVVPVQKVNPVQQLLSQGNIWAILVFAVILAPILEEFVFRKLLVDRLHVYGAKWAILFSGLAFAVTHGNFSQMSYAFFLGCMFAFIYIRTGRIRYTVILHMIINILGSIVPMLLEKSMNGNLMQDDLSTLWPMLVYLGVMFALWTAGACLFGVNRRKYVPALETEQMPEEDGKKIFWRNSGVIAMCILGIGLGLLSLSL